MNLQDWINPKYLDENKIRELKTQFLNNSPFEHLSIQDLFLEEKAKKLLESLKQEEYYIEDHDLYQFNRTRDFKHTQNKTIIEFRKFLMSEEFVNFFENLIKEKLDHSKMDLHSLKLENTNYLLCHDDQIQNRAYAFILNLSQNWKEELGGNLELYDNKNNEPTKVVKTVTPAFNQFNFFKVSDISFHQISENISNQNRISISGWYYRK